MQRLLRREGGRDGRIVVLMALGVYLEVLAIGAFMHGPPWLLFGVSSAKPAFLDMHFVTSGWECTRRGIDVYVTNPCDPLNRPWEYPQVWLWASHLGLGQGSAAALAVLMALLFGCSVWFVLGPLRQGEGIVAAALVLSPSVMLGVERGNVDLFVFTLVAVGLLLAGRSLLLATLLLASATLLKLFPIVASAVIAGTGRRRRLAAAAAIAGAFVAAVVVTSGHLGDLTSPRRDNATGVVLAFGGRDLWEGLALPYGFIPGLPISHDTAGTIGLVAWPLVTAALAARLAFTRELLGEDRSKLLPFAGGALIFMAAYVVGHSSDYRLVFLLLTVPQLLRWAREETAAGRVAAGVLLLLVLTLWSGALSAVVFPLDELLAWLLCVYLGAALLQLLREALRTAKAPLPISGY
jgi:hypothetical protein